MDTGLPLLSSLLQLSPFQSKKRETYLSLLCLPTLQSIFLYYIDSSNVGSTGYCRWCVICNWLLLLESICLHMAHNKRFRVGCSKSGDTSGAWQHCHLFECSPTVSQTENLLFTILMFSFWDLSVTKVEGSTQLHVASAVKLKGIYLLCEASMSHSEKFVEIVFIIIWSRLLLYSIHDLCSKSSSENNRLVTRDYFYQCFIINTFLCNFSI